jgi:1,4-alpha-glucan branching enzyme
MADAHLALVLHAHLPFVRHPEHERHLEERWFFEALLECYLPLLGVLDRLAADEVPVALTVSLTATLADMLDDPLLRRRFRAHVGRLGALVRAEQRRIPIGDARREAIDFYAQHFEALVAHYERIDGRLVEALVSHARAGRIELLASAATHAFLPGLLPVPRAAAAQIRIGVRAFEAQTGLDACGFWLPECAYDPQLDAMLAEAGVGHTVLEAHGVSLARPRPPFAGVSPILSSAGVAYFARDLPSSRQVWSRDEGYPGDPEYREFYRDIGFDLPESALLGETGPFGARVSTGLKYHRVSGPGVALAEKGVWRPSLAKARAHLHAAHYVASRVAHADAARSAMGAAGPPILVAPYDAELLGHWWFEGPWFLEQVFRVLADQSTLAPSTLRGHLERHPWLFRAEPAASTWGAAGQRAVWIGEESASVWRHVHHAAREVLALEAKQQASGARASATELRALEQATVELLLLSASDWPFIVSMGTARQYAESRARAHAARLGELTGALRDGTLDAARVEALAERDDFLAARGVVAPPPMRSS